MKYERLTERREAPLVMSLWEATKMYNRLAELENKIEDGELISTGQDEQSEQEIKFFTKHDVKVCKEVVKECLQVLRDMRMVCIQGYYSSGWNECIDRAIEQLTEKYYIDVEEVK